LACVVASACNGFIVGPSGGGGAGGIGIIAGGTGGSGVNPGSGGGDGADAGPPAYLSNLDVFTRLKPTCQGCHVVSDRPFFADLASFEGLIVYNTKWVRPQDPDGSDFLNLLQGTIGYQMPPLPSDTFKVLDTKGLTQIHFDELREWIRHLPPQGGVTPADPVVVHRKSTEQIVRTLSDQLGLTEDDLWKVSATGTLPYHVDPVATDAYAVRSEDATPPADGAGQGNTLYQSLGGAWWLHGNLTNNDVTPNMLQALVPVSQAWCRRAFAKPNNTAVLAMATLSDASTTMAGAANIKANIGYLYLRMLGEPAPQAEIDDLFDNVFKPYEGKGAAVAWTAVCAALVRDPQWILY
jgi:hypothetical protein